MRRGRNSACRIELGDQWWEIRIEVAVQRQRRCVVKPRVAAYSPLPWVKSYKNPSTPTALRPDRATMEIFHLRFSVQCCSV